MGTSPFSDPLVSVILCNYNYGRYVGEAIESVLSQSYENLQLIIVDDGSSDNSFDIISRYADRRIEIIAKENGGQASAFNVAYERVKGEFVAFLDSDDVWAPKKIALTVAAMRRGDLSVVQHNLEVIDNDSRRVGRIHPGIIPGRKNVLKAYFAENDTNYFSVTSGLVCRKRDLDKVFPLDVSWRICADVAITRPLPMFGETLTVPQVLGYYRVHDGNSWMNSDAQADIIENAKREFRYVNQWLEKLGYQQRLDFMASNYAMREVLRFLPVYHPRRMVQTARDLCWWKILYPAMMKLKTKGHGAEEQCQKRLQN